MTAALFVGQSAANMRLSPCNVPDDLNMHCKTDPNQNIHHESPRVPSRNSESASVAKSVSGSARQATRSFGAMGRTTTWKVSNSEITWKAVKAVRHCNIFTQFFLVLSWDSVRQSFL